MTQDYRPEIDGLRAVAVGSVLVYHAELTFGGSTLLTGGLLGVDVFFVISGYLICRIILRDLAAGTFRFRTFYERRARRILPALMVVLLASLPLAWISLTPKAALEYGGSLLSSLASVSNLWFWSEDSYVAEASLLKPLLHTWSLSVEEQFYLLTPAALLLLWRSARTQLPWLLGSALLVSLVLADQLSRSHPEAAFFLLPTRAWELLAGALLASIERPGVQARSRTDRMVAALSLAVLAASMVVFHDSWPHPSILTAIPVGATALLLATVGQADPAGRLLSAAPMRYLGKISYSLYLWHMPLFAFARNIGWLDGNLKKLGLLALSLFLADLTNRLIENPMRWKASRRLFWSVVGTAGVALTAAGLFILYTDGAAGRPVAVSQADQSADETADVEIAGSKAIILNVGDSHSGALSAALHAAALANGFSLKSISTSGTLPIEGIYYLAGGKFDQRYGPDAVAYVSQVIDSAIAAEVARGRQVFVALSGRLPLYLSNSLPLNPLTGQAEPGTTHTFTTDGRTVASFDQVQAALRHTTERWQALGASIVLVYPVPEMIEDVPAAAFRLGLADKQIAATDATAMPSIPLDAVRARAASAYALLDGVAGSDIIRIYPQDLVCDPSLCHSVLDGTMLYRDDDHLSRYGSTLVVDAMLAAIKARDPQLW